jgi:CDGSH-type Zn-finger protein
MDKPHIAQSQPCCVQVEKGRNYAWCTCGLSEKQPFCDGKHKAIEGMPFRPMIVQFEEDKEVWLCQCKQTRNGPYCDGSHRGIEGG